MRLTSRKLVILMLLLQLALVSCVHAGWWKSDKKLEEEAASAAKKAPLQKGEVPGSKKGAEAASRRRQPQEDDEFDEEDEDERAALSSKAQAASERLSKIGPQKEERGQMPQQVLLEAKGSKKRPDLDKIREAAATQERFESRTRNIPPRPGYSGNGHRVQGHGRRADRLRRREEEEAQRRASQGAENDAASAHGTHDNDKDHDHDDDDEDQDDHSDDELEDEFAASNLLDRIKNKKMRNHAATKFVSTKPQDELAKGLRKPNLAFLKTSATIKSGAISGTIKKNKLITGSYWQKKLGNAYEATKRGIKEGAKVLTDVPKYMEKSLDSINAFLQLDSKGKILALIEEANGDANFVRKEFSQFTLSWSPIMGKALEYLGDEDLDKIKWSDKDELDLKKDALHSLAFGYEFMRLMIIWRENLLLAHEAFAWWLESAKEEVEAKTLEVTEEVIIQARTTHAYMMLVTWMTIEEAAHEARTKLDYLMDVMDDRPKNYESEYFRNIVVLQELYEPTIEEFDKERTQVINSISESGVVVENLSDVDEFFEGFRASLLAHEVTSVDWEVPQQLKDFMAKIGPQLEASSLVYTKTFLKEMGLRK